MANKYMQWVNEFSDNYNNERYQIYENGGRKGTTNGFSPLFKSNGKISLTLNGQNSSDYMNNSGPFADADQRSFGSNENSQNSSLLNNKSLREKYKNKYVEELNQQIAEK